MSASPANIIRLVKSNGEYWIDLTMDGEALSRRGPSVTSDEAESVAIQIAGICKVFRQPMRIMATPARKRCA